MKSVDDEEFVSFESKIEEVTKILKMMNSSETKQQVDAVKLADTFLGKDPVYEEKLSRDDFVVKCTQDRTVINHAAIAADDQENPGMSPTAFMQEVERDAARRAAERRNRESVAQNLRKLGNQAFRNKEYEKAINLYTKAIDHVKDSSVLYNNRALTYIQLELYKKAVIDADFVLQKLDDKNLRSWLFRAKAYYLLGELRDFRKSINEAKKSNPKKIEFIESTAEKIMAENPELA